MNITTNIPAIETDLNLITEASIKHLTKTLVNNSHLMSGSFFPSSENYLFLRRATGNQFPKEFIQTKPEVKHSTLDYSKYRFSKDELKFNRDNINERE
jgi:hypothetical protein